MGGREGAGGHREVGKEGGGSLGLLRLRRDGEQWSRDEDWIQKGQIWGCAGALKMAPLISADPLAPLAGTPWTPWPHGIHRPPWTLGEWVAC